jgi:prevent-host-death family protein
LNRSKDKVTNSDKPGLQIKLSVPVRTVDIGQFKTHLSRLVEEAAEGTEIIIAKAGKPRARLIACEQEHAPRKLGKPRKLGWLKGKIWISDDFDAPLPDKKLRLWG